MQELQVLQQVVEDNPKDWVARFALADLLEEEGSMEESRYQRWSAIHRKAPVQWVKGWCWFWVSNFSQESEIGKVLIEELPKGTFASREEAEESLRAVLARNNWPAPVSEVRSAERQRTIESFKARKMHTPVQEQRVC